MMLPEEKCKGFHHVLTSDDIFFLPEQPKKVVVLGGGYIATECASFLRKLGSEVSMINRFKPLQRFDRQISEYLLNHFTKEGWEFICQSAPVEIVKEADGKFTVTYQNIGTLEKGVVRGVDQVLSALSRTPKTGTLNLQSVPEVKLTKNGKLIGGFNGEYERVTDNIYAIGDCLEGVPELTPVAIKSGRRLADKLDAKLSGYKTVTNLSLEYLPSTVFTWPEYSFIGYSEEEAKKKWGNVPITCFHSQSNLLESALEPEHKTQTYVKIVCCREEDGSNKVVGLHYVGANAGEVMQGFAVG
jgi:thioredoxin reductase (NADPH)